ncbi:MAG: hypothetical protein ACOX12_02315 [Eggerthellaceae bacterium]
MFDNRGMVDYLATDGKRRRVHREYVDVYVRMGRDGDVDPVTVSWRDGRSFHVDEVLDPGQFGPLRRGKQQRCYRVRFGGHETNLYLERREGIAALDEPPELRWWVYAYDETLSRKTEP